jgi:hypothetical protein
VILAIVVVAFANAFFFKDALLDNTSATSHFDMYGTYIVNLKESFRIVFGDFQTDNYDATEWVFFAFAVIIVTLIMMNILIAIVGDTYGKIRDNEVKNANI